MANESVVTEKPNFLLASSVSPPTTTTTSTTSTTTQEGEVFEDDLQNMMSHAITQNLSNPGTLQDLINSLNHKLQILSGDEKPPLLPLPPTDHHEAIPAPNTTTSPDAADADDVLIHSDTVILIVALVVMIVLGLVLRKVFLYLTQIRNRRERYHGGLKKFAEHMHVVTKTMSTDPDNPETSFNGTPASIRRLKTGSTPGSSGGIATNPSEIFTQPTYIMRRDDSVWGLATAEQEAKFKDNERKIPFEDDGAGGDIL